MTPGRIHSSEFASVLAGRHPKGEVMLTLMRLAVTGQLVETGGRYTLPPPGSAQG